MTCALPALAMATLLALPALLPAPAAAQVMLPQLQGAIGQIRSEAAGLLAALPGAFAGAARMAAAIGALRLAQVTSLAAGSGALRLTAASPSGPWPFGR